MQTTAITQVRAKTPESYLESPGEGKQWGPKTKVVGKVKQAATRAWVDAYKTITEGTPIPQGLEGRISRATSPFIDREELNSNVWVVRAAQNAAYALTCYTAAYRARYGTNAPGRLVAAAGENIFTLLLEKQEWSLLMHALKVAAHNGSYRVDLYLTQVAAGTPNQAPWRSNSGRSSAVDALIAGARTQRLGTTPQPTTSPALLALNAPILEGELAP